MLNNHNYILKKLKQAKIRENMSDTLLKTYENKVATDITEYISITWGKSITVLSETTKIVLDKKGEYTSTAKKEIKRILKEFNTSFQKIYHTQRAYCIPDVELRERVLAKTIGNKSFSKNPSKYISFPVPTIKNMIGQLFDESAK